MKSFFVSPKRFGYRYFQDHAASPEILYKKKKY